MGTAGLYAAAPYGSIGVHSDLRCPMPRTTQARDYCAFMRLYSAAGDATVPAV